VVLQLGNRTNRAGTVAAVASAVVPLAALPHVFEDLAEGVFAGFNLTPLSAGLLVGGALTVQLLGALGALRERRLGYVVILIAALAWIAIATMDHPGAFLPGEFREGFASRLSVWALVGTQIVAGFAAFRAVRSTRRGSFSGTGSYTGAGSSYGS
jgi:hypothetical protein